MVGGGRGDPKICSYLSEIIIRESFIMREVRPEALALTAEARGVCFFQDIESRVEVWYLAGDCSRGGIWLLAEHKAKQQQSLPFKLSK